MKFGPWEGKKQIEYRNGKAGLFGIAIAIALSIGTISIAPRYFPDIDLGTGDKIWIVIAFLIVIPGLFDDYFNMGKRFYTYSAIFWVVLFVILFLVWG